MQRLEVSCAGQRIYTSLGAKGVTVKLNSKSDHARKKSLAQNICIGSIILKWSSKYYIDVWLRIRRKIIYGGSRK